MFWELITANSTAGRGSCWTVGKIDHRQARGPSLPPRVPQADGADDLHLSFQSVGLIWFHFGTWDAVFGGSPLHPTGSGPKRFLGHLGLRLRNRQVYNKASSVTFSAFKTEQKALLSKTAEQYRDSASGRARLKHGLAQLANQARTLARQDATELVQLFGEMGRRTFNLAA